MKFLLNLLLLVMCLPEVQAQNRNEVVIDEIMADPSPPAGLPPNEWIELRNTSTHVINLLNWRFGDETGQSGPLPSFLLGADSVVIICSNAATQVMTAYGSVFPVSNFPLLDNEADNLFISDANGKTIHAISYSIIWYQNELKKEGGWSLEMIDPKNPCSRISNWKASTSLIGGTPGKINSVNAINPDIDAPEIISSYTLDNRTVVLVFNEPIDSTRGTLLTNYSIDGGIGFSSATGIAPLFDQVALISNSALSDNFIYTVTVNHIADCSNNAMSHAETVKSGIPVDPKPEELIVNEILFNPRPNGYDYVECYNRSSKIFDAAKLSIANRNSAGTISSIEGLTDQPFYIFPGDFIVITEDAMNLEGQYLVRNPGSLLIPGNLPSFPDEGGNVVLLNYQGEPIDEVRYKDDWHFKLIDNAEGIALERINPDGSSSDPSNWHSAASTAGFGTPTYKNSQFLQPANSTSAINVLPKIFSPDNDGFDDVAAIQYVVKDLGYVANITVFDAAGRPIRNLVRNGILGLEGYWNWDGLDDKGLRLPIGIYIIYAEIFNLKGKKERFKNTVVLARKVN